MKRILCNNEQEYKAHVQKIISAIHNEVDIWEGHDYERLKPFFEWSQNDRHDGVKPDQEIQDSIDYYLSIAETDEHREVIEFRDSLSGAGKYINIIEEAYGIIPDHDCYDFDDDGNPIDEEGNPMSDETKWEDWVGELTYPLIVVEAIDSGWDRAGDFFQFVMEFIELKDFGLKD